MTDDALRAEYQIDRLLGPLYETALVLTTKTDEEVYLCLPVQMKSWIHSELTSRACLSLYLNVDLVVFFHVFRIEFSRILRAQVMTKKKVIPITSHDKVQAEPRSTVVGFASGPEGSRPGSHPGLHF